MKEKKTKNTGNSGHYVLDATPNIKPVHPKSSLSTEYIIIWNEQNKILVMFGAFAGNSETRKVYTMICWTLTIPWTRLQTNRGYKKTNRNTDFWTMIFVSYSRIRIFKIGICICTHWPMTYDPQPMTHDAFPMNHDPVTNDRWPMNLGCIRLVTCTRFVWHL